MRQAIVLLLTYFFALGCGVKGNPSPPERRGELGRGRPTYKRATEGLKIKKIEPEEVDEEEDSERE